MILNNRCLSLSCASSVGNSSGWLDGSSTIWAKITALAVASRSLPLFYEAEVRNGFLEGVPLAGYGPRGSEESVNNIQGLIRKHDLLKGMLLENHGVLAFADNAKATVQANVIIEETAQLALWAEGLGGPTILTPERAGAAVKRHDDFAAKGTQQA